MQFSIQERLLYRTVQRFRGGLVFKAHRLFYNSAKSLSRFLRLQQLEAEWRPEGSMQSKVVAPPSPLTPNLLAREGPPPCLGVRG